jgi:hypothetical protein
MAFNPIVYAKEFVAATYKSTADANFGAMPRLRQKLLHDNSLTCIEKARGLSHLDSLHYKIDSAYNKRIYTDESDFYRFIASFTELCANARVLDIPAIVKDSGAPVLLADMLSVWRLQPGDNQLANEFCGSFVRYQTNFLNKGQFIVEQDKGTQSYRILLTNHGEVGHARLVESTILLHKLKESTPNFPIVSVEPVEEVSHGRARDSLKITHLDLKILVQNVQVASEEEALFFKILTESKIDSDYFRERLVERVSEFYGVSPGFAASKMGELASYQFRLRSIKGNSDEFDAPSGKNRFRELSVSAQAEYRFLPGKSIWVRVSIPDNKLIVNSEIDGKVRPENIAYFTSRPKEVIHLS